MVFGAVVHLGRTRVEVDLVAALADFSPLRPPDASGVAQSGRCTGVALLHGSTAESRHEEVPYTDPRTGCVVFSWVRLDNRDELGTALGWDSAQVRAATDPEFLSAAWDLWGTDCADRLEGDFSFAIWDPRTERLFAARDSLGVRPLYYAQTGDAFAVSTNATFFSHVAGVDVGPSPEWMALFLDGLSMDWDSTALIGVSKLRPGHWILVTGAAARMERYHEFVDDPPWESERDPVWLGRYRTALFHAVEARMRTDRPIGVESSGGLDSSTIVALIAHLDPACADTMHTFGFATAPLEPEYLLETSRVLRITNNHVFTRYGVDDGDELGCRILGHPVEHSNAVGHIPFYRLAAQLGVATLHSGHGGDEAVTQSAAMATREALSRGDYRLALRDLPGYPLLRPARLAKRKWSARQPVNRAMTDAMMGRLRQSILTDETLRDLRIEGRVRQAAVFDAPFERVNRFVLENRLGPHVSTRTAECSLVASAHGIDYRWPLLDRVLIQQYLSTPTVWKYANGQGRYLHRRAISGIVPAKVTWKPGKDMGNPDSEQASGQTSTPHWSAHDLPDRLRQIVDPAKLAHVQIDRNPANRNAHVRSLANLTALRDWLER